MNQHLKTFISIYLVIFFSPALIHAQETEQQPSGGNYVLSKAVVAGGGKPSAQTTQVVNGTAGQTIAGNNSSGGPFQIYSGFWTPETLAPTAAFCVVRGHVSKELVKEGLTKVSVTITGGANAITKTVMTDSNGDFIFVDIEAGGFYIITVERKGYTFSPNIQSINVVEDVSDLNFTGIKTVRN